MSIYRLILKSAPGRYDTGATYPTCSQANPSGCQPQQFATLADAVNYSYAHNETPVWTTTANEAWAIVAGTQQINTADILPAGTTADPGGSLFGMDTTTLLLIGGGLLLLFASRKRG